jgi:hypothetical protein
MLNISILRPLFERRSRREALGSALVCKAKFCVGIQDAAECRGKVLFVHLVHWNIGIAQFPPGRLREMTALRKQLAAWNSRFVLCGDYLDGLSSEGTLRTGEEPPTARQQSSCNDR